MEKLSTIKVCHKCKEPVVDNFMKFPNHEGIYFHQHCFNPYEHYYGLDKPID